MQQKATLPPELLQQAGPTRDSAVRSISGEIQTAPWGLLNIARLQQHSLLAFGGRLGNCQSDGHEDPT